MFAREVLCPYAHSRFSGPVKPQTFFADESSEKPIKWLSTNVVLLYVFAPD
jgi:hypothetical protein